MICRIADKKFRGTELSGEELQVKTGFIIDDLLPIIGETQHKEVIVQDIEISESDEEY